MIEMPNRLLREGICSSDLIDALTPEEEVLFYRLLVVCDDYGHMDGRPAIIKAQCFPLKESATSASIARWLEGLIRADLVGPYTIDGKPYLAISKWEHRVRTHPKYPLPQQDDGTPCALCGSLSADCGHGADTPPSDCGLGKGKGKGKGKGAKTCIPENWVPEDQTRERLSREFGLVPEDVDRYVAAFVDICKSKGYQYVDFNAAFANCMRQDWPKLRGADGKVVPIARKKALPV